MGVAAQSRDPASPTARSRRMTETLKYNVAVVRLMLFVRSVSQAANSHVALSPHPNVSHGAPTLVSQTKEFRHTLPSTASVIETEIDQGD